MNSYSTWNELHLEVGWILYPMATMAMYWNYNYCVEFLDEMITYCGKEDNVLAGNLFVLLSSLEIIAMSRLGPFCILQLYFQCAGLLPKPVKWLNTSGATLN